MGVEQAAKLVAGIAFGVALIAVGVVLASRPGTAKPLRTVRYCERCGAKWTSFGNKPAPPITKCPECPMSMEEFERLKESVRNRPRPAPAVDADEPRQ